jgi:hypothetical protein
MATMNVVPEIWAREIVEQLPLYTALGSVAKIVTGEINRKGDQLHIIGADAVSVAAYPASDNITYAAAADSDNTLLINTDYYGAVKIEDDTARQSPIDVMPVYARDIARKLAEQWESDGLIEAYTNAAADSFETGSTAWQLGTGGADVPAMLTSINKQLDDVGAPRAGRYIILPTIGVQALTLYAASRATNFGDTASTNGYVGKMFGFDVYTSNKCPIVSTVVHGVAGVSDDGIAGAIAIPPSEVEEIRLEGRFASGIRSRALYGWKVFRSNVLVDVNLNTTLLA